MRLSQITEDVVRGLVAKKRLGTNKYGQPVTNSTINRYLALLRAMLRKAWLELKWIDRPPLIKLFKEPKGVVRWLEMQQVSALLKELPDHQRLMTIFALCVGLRQGNVKRLRWDQIDMRGRVLRVDADDAKGQDHIGVPLNDVAIWVLNRCFGNHATYVFTYNARPVTQVNTRAWRNALRRAGIEKFRWHDLRHTWASWLRQKGVAISDIQEMGKWKSGKMVERYAHLNVEHLRPHSEMLGGMLGSALLPSPDDNGAKMGESSGKMALST